MLRMILVLLAVVMVSIPGNKALGQTVSEKQQVWRSMLEVIYGHQPRPTSFAVIERARSGQILSFAHQDGVGWWMCFDDRPSMAGARVEVVNFRQARAGLAWLGKLQQQSRFVDMEADREQRMDTLAIFDPGSPEFAAVPMKVEASGNKLSLSVQARNYSFVYQIDRLTSLPTSILIRVPYRKLFPTSPDRDPDATTDTLVELGYHASTLGPRELSTIRLRGVRYDVHVHTNIVLLPLLFDLPITELAKNPTAWQGEIR